MLSYYVVYDFISTEVINIFDNNSQNLLTTYEQCADHLRDTAGFSGQYCSLACFFCSLHPLLHLLPVSLAMLVSLPDLTTSLDPPPKKTPSRPPSALSQAGQRTFLLPRTPCSRGRSSGGSSTLCRRLGTAGGSNQSDVGLGDCLSLHRTTASRLTLTCHSSALMTST